MIELASVIRDLRDELERAIVAGAGEALQFELGPVELEVSLAVEQSGQAGAKVRFWVVEAGGERGRESTDTQRIKLVLTPRLGEGAHGAFVGGAAVPGER
jgi:hypothetical protein